MKIRARTNGNVIDADQALATELIDRGLYEAVVESRDASAPKSLDPPPAPRKKAPK